MYKVTILIRNEPLEELEPFHLLSSAKTAAEKGSYKYGTDCYAHIVDESGQIIHVYRRGWEISLRKYLTEK
jgi:hypothetical protein